MTRIKIIERIELLDVGDYYRWRVKRKGMIATSQGFNSMSHGIDVLKEYISITRKSNKVKE